MNFWGEEIPLSLLSTHEQAFLEPFAQRPRLTLEEMWHQLDTVWCSMGLNDCRSETGIAAYYAHPVWILNAIFTAVDPVSVGHRQAIARWLAEHGMQRIADFGGGGGQLACEIAKALPEAKIDIIEPYPNPLGRHRTIGQTNIRWCANLDGEYDAVIAQDVLEHVTDPVATTAKLVGAIRIGGSGIFANCFHPVIFCHLPETFYLRHTFDSVMHPLGICFRQRIPSAEHARVYARGPVPPGKIDLPRVRQREMAARIVGPFLNLAADTAFKLRHCFKTGWGQRD